MADVKIDASFQNGVATVKYSDDGRKRVKSVSAEAFCNALLTGIQTSKQVTLNPLGLRVHATSGDKMIVGYEMPERVGEMPFRMSRDSNDIERIKSVWPWGITFIEFNKTPEGYRWSTFYQFGLKGAITGIDTQMFVWPGSNVYGGHNCCIGEINIPKLRDISQTGGLPFIFYNGVSNRDLQENRFNDFNEGSHKIDTPYKLYKDVLQVKDGQMPKPFPYNIMISAKTIKSFLEEKGYL